MNGCERDLQKEENTGYVPKPHREAPKSTQQDCQERRVEELRNVLATYIPANIMQTVENNGTRQCRYMLFHVPFTLMLCDALQLQRNPSQSLFFQILLDQIKRLQELNDLVPRQLPPEEVITVISNAVNFQKRPPGFFLRELGRFVEEHAIKLATFMPYFDALFRLVLRREAYLTKQSSVEQLAGLLRETIAGVRAKYHNYDLQ